MSLRTESGLAECVLRLTQRTERLESNEEPATIPTLQSFGTEFFAHHLTVAASKFHDDLVPDLDRYAHERRLRECYVAPRGSAKTTWSTLILPLFCAIYGLEKYIIIVSDVQPNANKFLRNIKEELLHNEKLKAEFPGLCVEGSVWQAEAIELPNGVRIEALGKGGRIRGRKHRQHRPSLIVCDDLQSLDDAYSELQMEKDFEWLNADVMKAGSPDTNYLVLGTALAANCIVCKLEKTPGWKFKRYSSLLAEPKHTDRWNQWKELLWHHDDPQREEKARGFYEQYRDEMDTCVGRDGADLKAEDAVLWPERFPLYDLMFKRVAEGERAFASEEQGYPMPPGNAEWPAEYFDHAQFWFDEWPTGNLLELYALDPSKGKQDKAGDYQAFGRIVIDRYFVFYVEAWLEKMNVSELCDFMVDLYRDRPGEAVVLEGNGFQELLQIPFDQSGKKQGVNMPFFTVINTVAKPVRIRRLTGELSQRLIRFKRGSRGTALLVDQLRAMRIPTPLGQHDDGPDMLEMGIRIAKKLMNRKATA